MDCGIFNVRTYVNACDCTRACTDTVRESALKVDSWRKIPCCIGESNLRRQRAGLMLYQLSYIPTRGIRLYQLVFPVRAHLPLPPPLSLLSFFRKIIPSSSLREI